MAQGAIYLLNGGREQTHCLAAQLSGMVLSRSGSVRSSNVRGSGQNCSGRSAAEGTRWGDVSTWALSGGVAGLVADTVAHPFDTISTRQKLRPPSEYSSFAHTTREIARREGAFRGLFSGVGATILCALPATGVYFCAYEVSKAAGQSFFGESGEDSMAFSVVHFFSGAVAELACSTIQVPFEVVKTRMQLGKSHQSPWGAGGKNYASCLAGFRSIVRADGVRGLYAGYKSCIALDCTYAALQFAIYEKTKLAVSLHRHADDKITHFVSGSAAGFVAAWITNPLEVVASRLMTKDAQTRAYSPRDWIRLGLTAKGVRTMWRGSLARSLMMASHAAVTFTVYEYMKRLGVDLCNEF